MKLPPGHVLHAVILLLAALALAPPVFAEKPAGAGGGKPDKQAQRDKGAAQRGDARHDDGRDHGRADDGHADSRGRDHDDDGNDNEHGRDGNDGARREASTGMSGAFFGGRHREAAREYYHAERGAGRCPPGLKKKHNGCVPPGLAKNWTRGRPLPPDVIYYDLPSELVVRFGPPPAGQRLVRVATDILLIAVGTGLVLDALEDLDAL